MKQILYSYFIFVSFTLAQAEVSNAELSGKLDLILNKMNGIEERVTKLETKNIQVNNEIKQVSKIAKEAKKEASFSIPENEEEKNSFFSKLRIQLKSDEAKSKGAWTKKETWDQVNKTLTEFKIRKLLGNPTSIKISINPRIERIYFYNGDLNADGIKESGHVNFFRERVVSFKSPF